MWPIAIRQINNNIVTSWSGRFRRRHDPKDGPEEAEAVKW